MNCTEFHDCLPEALEETPDFEYERHLHSCAECASLFSDLKEICSTAPQLQQSEMPSDRLWKAIEATLRDEGIIRAPRLVTVPVVAPTPPARRWRLAWLAPVAAALVMTGGTYFYHQQKPAPDQTAAFGAEDQELLQELSERGPAVRASYASDLQNVNSYIQDAQMTLREDPNDEEAQRALMGAYEQRSMIYGMALDRSLP